jgi:hypothetical protein
MSNVVQILLKPKGFNELELIRPQCAKQTEGLLCFWALFMRIQPKAEQRNTKPRCRESKILESPRNNLLLDLWSNRKMVTYKYQPKADPIFPAKWPTHGSVIEIFLDFNTKVLKSSQRPFFEIDVILVGIFHHIVLVIYHILAEISQNM